MRDITRFLFKKLNISTCKDFSRCVLNRYNTSGCPIGVENVFWGNNRLKFNRKKREYVLRINFRRIMRKKLSNAEKLFCLECEILHEFEHAMTFVRCISGVQCDYYSFMVLLEYLSQIKFQYNRIDDKLSLIDVSFLCLFIKKNYTLSISEIKSNLFAYENAMRDFRVFLDKSKCESVDRYIELNRILLETIDIAYIFNATVNKSQYVFQHAIQTLNRNPFLLEKFKVFNSVYDGEKIKSIYMLFKEKELNPGFYDNLIFNIFINTKNDYTEFFQDVEFKKYIENLIGEFNVNVMKYHEYIEEFSMITKRKSSIYENYALLKRKVLLLNSLMQKYNLERVSGLVLDNKFNF